jgi:hypothetical protein
MVVFAFCIMPDLEYHGTEATATPPYGTKLFRIVVLLVYQIDLIENLLRFLQADPVLSLHVPALRPFELQPHRLYNCYTILPIIDEDFEVDGIAAPPQDVFDSVRAKLRFESATWPSGAPTASRGAAASALRYSEWIWISVA